MVTTSTFIYAFGEMISTLVHFFLCLQNVRLDNEVLQQLLAQCHNEQLDTTQNSSTEQ